LAFLEQAGEEHHDDCYPDPREGEEDAPSLGCQVGGMGKVHGNGRRKGATLAVLEASTSGLPVDEGLGFQTTCETTTWERLQKGT
jgi:hypothetical protein